MARKSKKGGKTSAAKARKPRSVKGRNPKTQAQKTQTVDPKQLITKLQRELDQARGELAARNTAYTERIAYQAAANDVLKVMSASPGDPQPVFDLISVRARDLCDAYGVTVYEFDGSLLHWRAATGVSDDPAVREAAKAAYPSPPSRHLLPNRAILDRAVVHVRDHDADAELRRISLTVKSSVVVPFMRGNMPIGALHMGSRERGGFSDAQIGLLETFADQAVIAIENARLFNETQETLERQTATADILKVIAGSPTDVQPVFDAIAESAKRLLASHTAVVTRVVDEVIHFAASTAESEAPAHAAQGLLPYPLSSERIHARVARTGQVAVNTDAPSSDLPQEIKDFARTVGWRSMLVVPMLRNEIAIGTIGITRREPGAFDDKTVDLLKTFANQAVIAIENARLFNETKEALARQTATADVLKVIASSPSNLQPVFDAIAERSNELMSGHATTVFRFIGETAELAAFTSVNTEADAVLRAAFPRPISTLRDFEQVSRGQNAETIDAIAETEPETSRNIARARGFRSRLVVPLNSDSSIIGAISITRRQPGAFAPQDVELLRTFADQAVIAIENARLFDEVQAKTRDLEEALRYQTGSASILNVIASSPTDVRPVLQAIVESACELCGAYDAVVVLKDGQDLQASAHHGPIPLSRQRWANDRTSSSGRAIADRRPVHVHDVLSDEGAEFALARTMSSVDGCRTLLSAPLMREGEAIGAVALRRAEVHPFSEKQIALLQTFADQAVIALGNVRLFEEVQARTRDLAELLEQQTATSEVLQIISSTPDDLEPVFQKMLENATRVCGAKFGTLILYEGDLVRRAALYNVPPAFAALQKTQVRQPHPQSGLSLIARTKQVTQVDDLRAHAPYLQGDPMVVALSDLAGARTIVMVPMLKEDELIGAISIYRQEVKPFTDKQIALVSNFANQAVIAIENTRLLKELRKRTDDLSTSLNELRTAQDRLVQTEKLASLGQLTAGIAHEIKNPLNFVNNFSALSVELTDELNEALKQATLADKLKEEVDELTGLLKDNLSKVVQHGKRADSIVKNMLQHSREGSGERRSADINALVGESLNLAYHGARAEKPGFAITLKHDLDPEAGAADLYPQEVTRALLNLISNGFYAATRRKAEVGDEPFEPVLSAVTKNLGSTVEIRIRDNGTGIPPDVREKMFNPFFTTKPTGEGTGLGLSMTHDIIVKQHGGRIDVETEPGTFTEFIITLPRGNGPAARSKPE